MNDANVPSGPPPAGAPVPDTGFSLRKRFPGEGPPVPPPAPAVPDAPAPAARSRVFTRIVLPLLVFTLVVGGIAYVTQNLPSRRKEAPAARPKPTLEAHLKILERMDPQRPGIFIATWDQDDPRYIAELEPQTEGHYYFAFENPADKIIELGLYETRCDCSQVAVAILPDEMWKGFAKKPPDQKTLEKAKVKDLAW